MGIDGASNLRTVGRIVSVFKAAAVSKTHVSYLNHGSNPEVILPTVLTNSSFTTFGTAKKKAAVVGGRPRLSVGNLRRNQFSGGAWTVAHELTATRQDTRFRVHP